MHDRPRDAPPARIRPSFATTVLAAGRSERFGGFPKALLRVGERTALERIVAVARDVSDGPVVVAVPPGSAPVRAVAESTGALVVASTESEVGRTGSLRAALGHIDSERSVVVWPVDHPLVEAMTVRALDDAVRRDLMATWVIPTFAGRRGHPILFTPAARPNVDALPRNDPLRSLLPRLGVGVRRVGVNDPAVVENLDTPAEYDRAVSAWRLRGGS